MAANMFALRQLQVVESLAGVRQAARGASVPRSCPHLSKRWK